MNLWLYLSPRQGQGLKNGVGRRKPGLLIKSLSTLQNARSAITAADQVVTSSMERLRTLKLFVLDNR